jgi:cell division septal protein FtsQ
MIFNRNKTRPIVPRKSLVRRPASPSWKSFKTQKRRPAPAGLGRRDSGQHPVPYGAGNRRPVVSVRTPRLVVSEVRLILLKLAYNALFLLLAAGIIYFLFFSEWFQISKIMVEGNKTIDKRLILDVVEPYLHKKVLGIFPSNNFFFIPTSRIEGEITADFKRIGSVKVDRGFPSSLAIRLEEKKAVLLFCGNGGCIWVDEEGVAYNKSSYAEALADSGEVVIVQDNSNSSLEAGQMVTTPAYVDYANRLWRSFPEKIGKELEYLSTPLPSAEEIRANTREGFLVYFDIDTDLDRSLALLKKVIDEEIVGKGSQTACLDYIDLRVTDRVFYKMKDNCGGQNPENGGENPPAENPESADNQDNPDQAVQPAPDITPKTAATNKNKKKKKKN